MRCKLPLAMAAIALTSGAQAHHSAAMFDMTKTVTLRGTVSDFQWTNPHCWIELYGSDKGPPEKWSIEGTSPSSMSRFGWKHGSIKPGDKVTLTMHPKRDGGTIGSLVTATLADGSTLSMAPK